MSSSANSERYIKTKKHSLPTHAHINSSPLSCLICTHLQMKEVRMKNMITSGPQSHILEGVNWEEARQYAASQVDGTAPANHVVMVGAASKGIIQRDFQHNATVYKSAYAKNPFDNVTEEELAEYRLLIERKNRGEIGTATCLLSVSLF